MINFKLKNISIPVSYSVLKQLTELEIFDILLLLIKNSLKLNCMKYIKNVSSVIKMWNPWCYSKTENSLPN